MLISHLCKPEAIEGEQCVAQGIRIAPRRRSRLVACMQMCTPFDLNLPCMLGHLRDWHGFTPRRATA